MSFTMTRTVSESFTLTHSKYLASKVTSDMWRCQQLYSYPPVAEINNYGTELAILLRDGYVAAYEFGFRIGDQRLISWRYTVDSCGLSGCNDRPGRIVSGVDVIAASFFNQLTYSSIWVNLQAAERETILAKLPVQRVQSDGPKDGLGYWQQDRCYSANGTSVSRSTFRPFTT
jgi:hypothetical protein